MTRRSNGRYQVPIWHLAQSRYVGCYPTKEAAASAYRIAEEVLSKSASQPTNLDNSVLMKTVCKKIKQYGEETLLPHTSGCGHQEGKGGGGHQVSQCDGKDGGGFVVDHTCGCVHYHHRDHPNDVPYVDSCHTCVDPMDHHRPDQKLAATAWCHVFKSSNPSSLQTQAAWVAHLQPSSLGKSIHCRTRRAKRKHSKQQGLLRECVVTIEKSLMLSTKDIKEQSIVFDGGSEDTPCIQPPDGVQWCCIRVGMEIYIEDELNPQVGLTYSWINNALPFIRLPQASALGIFGDCNLTKIIYALDACLKIKKSYRGDKKRISSDLGEHIKFCCAGIQVSRNSKEVHDHAPFMKNLSQHHWNEITWIMRSAEECFEMINDHQVLSQMHHAKKQVPFKTMTTPSSVGGSSFWCYASMAIGCNVFLPCHTDQDFTMSIVQAFLCGVKKYDVDDSIVVYFCFPTLGVAILLRPGDYLIFNPLIPHCVSSRCNHTQDVLLVTMYLKTAVVGLNNNDIDITQAQASLVSMFHSKNENA